MSAASPGCTLSHTSLRRTSTSSVIRPTRGWRIPSIVEPPRSNEPTVSVRWNDRQRKRLTLMFKTATKLLALALAILAQPHNVASGKNRSTSENCVWEKIWLRYPNSPDWLRLIRLLFEFLRQFPPKPPRYLSTLLGRDLEAEQLTHPKSCMARSIRCLAASNPSRACASPNSHRAPSRSSCNPRNSP
jgi:hypothetical protein